MEPGGKETVLKFRIGDRVQVPEGTSHVPMNILGKEGAVENFIWGTKPSTARPFEWELEYVVRFDGEGHLSFIREEWTVAA